MKKSSSFIKLCNSYGVDPDKVPEILSFEEACKVTGDDPNQLPLVEHLLPGRQKRILSDHKLTIIAEALKEMRLPDYTNNGERKYFAVFDIEADAEHPSGFGLSFDDYDHWFTTSAVGVRHCFPNTDLTIFFGKHFIDLHKDHHLYT